MSKRAADSRKSLTPLPWKCNDLEMQHPKISSRTVIPITLDSDHFSKTNTTDFVFLPLHRYTRSSNMNASNVEAAVSEQWPF